ncbi:peroxiredoxin [Sphingomonas parapaucimobilis]|uniref:Glutathione-dependent peroxiredoxin n=1 Tax=Sphingomonas parapaucimobilis NBRC 15100 TaxID=1219049 RepID=A0A0A1W2Z3_9SPHN|nr:peroxiredoxin [Sphingomonas parapaucimobilis]GAL99581.1 putative peroxiredoxin [Sphingomonas parapaucimobilis NBRC 15100]
MTIKVGDRLPSITLVKVTPEGPEQVNTADYFAGKRVALFAVPGAFTPTCSAQHLPGFIAQADAVKAKGVNEIACTSVNDVFVMKAWRQTNNAGEITMLADGNADLAKAVGLTLDGSKFGMGTRSQRYTMLVNDGVVEQLFVEAPGEFKVSSAEHLLSVL